MVNRVYVDMEAVSALSVPNTQDIGHVYLASLV